MTGMVGRVLRPARLSSLEGRRNVVVDVSVAALVTAVAAVVRFVGIGDQSFWVDETVTARLVFGSFSDLVSALPRSESTPPLYYLLAWCWSRLFGTGEAALRSLSALLGTLTVPVAIAVGRELVSRRTGLIVGALAAVSPVLVWYSQEARAYALFIFLGALSLLAFVRAMETRGTTAAARWAVVSALVIATHYFGAFLIAAEAAFLLYRWRCRTVVVASAGLAAAAIALLPLAAYQATHASSSWIRSVDLHRRLEETVAQLLVPSRPSIWAGAGVPESPVAWWPLGLVALAAAACAAVALHRGRQRRGVVTSLVLGIAAAGGPVIVSLASAALVAGRGDVLLFRNVLCAWLPLQIVVAAALAAPRAGRVGLAAAAALTAASLAVLVVNTTTAHLQRDDWRLLSRATRGEGHAIVLSPSWEVAGLEYYAARLSPPSSVAPLREIDVLVRRWMPSYSTPVRSFVPPPGFERVEQRTLQNWVLTRFRASTPVEVSSAQLQNVRPLGASHVVLVRPAPTGGRR